jgi:predicted  nucleic acid-binding Zn-ribbon protein
LGGFIPGGIQMKRILVFCLISWLVVAVLSSCAQEDILKALKIDYTPAPEKISAEQKTISDLRAQLAASKKKEKELSNRIGKLEQEISEKEASLSNQVGQLEQEIAQQETELNEQIMRLKEAIDEQESIISIQGKVIGLLDDAEQTLQKSIEAQLRQKARQ